MKLLEAAGYSCTKAGASLGVFDILAVSSSDVVGVQVKSNVWPSAVELEAIREFRAPANFRRIVHRWRDRRGLPDVREL